MDAVHFSSKTEEWGTPQDFFDKLNEEFHLTLDVCSTHENAKCAKHYTKEDDGLAQDWTGETVWCNPPYGREMPKWIRKCAEHAKQGGWRSCLFRHEPTRKHFTNTFTASQKSVSFVGGCISSIKTESRERARRSRLWL